MANTRVGVPDTGAEATATETVLSLDRFGNISEWRVAAERIFGHSAKEMLGKPLSALTIGQSDHPSGRDFKSLAATATPIIYMLDRQGRFLFSEGESLAALGLKPGEAVGRSAFEIYQNFPPIIEGIRRALGGHVAHCTHRIGSTTFDVLFTPRTNAVGQVIGVIGMGTDITRQQQAEASLSTLITASLSGSGPTFFKRAVESLARWLDIDCVFMGQINRQDHVMAVAMYLDGHHVRSCEYDLLGTPCKQVEKNGYHEVREHVAALFPEDGYLKLMGFESYVGVPIRRTTGTVCRGTLCALGRKPLHLPPGAREVLEAVAARAAAEMAFDRSQTALHEETHQTHRILSTVRDGFIVMDANGLICTWNSAAETLFGWSSSEVMGRSLASTIVPVRFRKAHCDGLQSFLATGAGHISGRPVEQMALHRDGHEIPIEMSITPQKTVDGFEFYAFVRNISAKKRVEQTLQEHTTRIERVLGGTIAAMSKAVEARDPYTAGHQSRTAHLSRAIGRELGWDDDRVQGLFFGAEIHDIGKIGIPAEILSKPGPLSKIEFEIIKTHPKVGYDIIKSIDFPWPLADMVCQHHERLDGSGYPHGLKGDSICMEARVLAVADVMEAMWSHRPYRPARGAKVAWQAIEDGRSTLYDANVIAACGRLFSRTSIANLLNPDGPETPCGFVPTKVPGPPSDDSPAKPGVRSTGHGGSASPSVAA